MLIYNILLEVLGKNPLDFDLTFIKSKLDLLKMHDISKNFSRFIVVIEGQIEVSINDEVQTHPTSSIIILGQGNKSWWKAERKSQVLEVVFEVDELVIELLHNGKTHSAFIPHKSNIIYKELQQLNTRLSIEDHKDLNTPYKLPLTFYYLSLCHQMVSDKKWQKSKKGLSKKRFKFREIQSYINQNVDKNLTREDLCQKFRINERSIADLFQFWEGRTFKQYLIDLKMNEARNYLFKNKVSIKDLSEKFGFNSVDHFIYSFRVHFSYSPLKLKKLLKKENTLTQLQDLHKLKGFEYIKEAKSLGSYKEGKPQVCYVINETGDNLELYWMNTAGENIPIATIPPHVRIRCNTAVGHYWIGIYKNSQTKIYQIPAQSSQILFC